MLPEQLALVACLLAAASLAVALLARQRAYTAEQLAREALKRLEANSGDSLPARSPNVKPQAPAPQPARAWTPPPAPAPAKPQSVPNSEGLPPPLQKLPERASPASMPRIQTAVSKPASALPKVQSNEFQWGSRWATYLGLAMAVLGAVFFGVHAGRHTTPPVRWCGMAGLSLSFLLVGQFMQTRWQGYARALFAGGLALVYLTAFAAYAFPPVRIVTDPLTGWMLQVAALSIIVIVAAAKRSALIAYLATGLGTVAGFFTIALDLTQFTLPYALGWTLGLVCLGSWRKWDRVQIAGLSVGIFLFATRLFAAIQAESAFPTINELTSTAAIWTGILFFAGLACRQRWENSLFRERTLALGAAFMVGLHLLAVWHMHPPYLSGSYLIWALVFAIASPTARLAQCGDRLVVGWALKAATLFALFVVARFDGEVRMLALAVEGWSLILLWRRNPHFWTACAWGGLWFVACGFLLLHAFQFAEASITWITAITFAVGFLSLLEELRFRPALQTAGAMPPSQRETARWIGLIGHAILALIAALCLRWLLGHDAQIFGWLATGLVVMSYGGLRKSPETVSVGISLWALSHVAWWGQPETGSVVSAQLLGIFLILSGGILLAATRDQQSRQPHFKKTLRQLEIGIHAVGLLTVAVWLPNVANYPLQSLIFALLALIAALTPSWVLFSAPRLSLLSAALALSLPISGIIQHNYHPDSPLYLGVWLLLVAHGFIIRWERHRPTDWWGAAATLALVTHLILSFAAWVLVQIAVVDESWLVLSVLAALAITELQQHFQREIATAVLSAVFRLILWTYMCLWAAGIAGTSFWEWLNLAAGICILLTPLFINAGKERKRYFMTAAGVLFALSIIPFGIGSGAENHATAVWAAAAFSVFAIGLITRHRSVRVVSLIALGLTILRAFVVDLDQTFERIIAFFGLGITFLAIGFLYQRLQQTESFKNRSMIERNEDKPGDADVSAEPAKPLDKP